MCIKRGMNLFCGSREWDWYINFIKSGDKTISSAIMDLVLIFGSLITYPDLAYGLSRSRDLYANFMESGL